MTTAPTTSLANAAVAVHAVELTAASIEQKWVQLIPVGTFSGRDGRGPWVAEANTLQCIIDLTRAYHGKIEPVVDYDHQSIFGAQPGVGGKAPAAGWVKDMEVRADGIWGRVEWTENAATAIKAKEYRYLSPVFFHEPDTGRVLAIRMAGLTNTPNLDLVPVAANSLTLNNPTGDSMDKILAALGLAKGVNEDGVVAAINALQTSSTALAKAAGLTETAKPAEVLTAVNSMVADRSKLAEAAGLRADAKSADVLSAVQAACSTTDPTKFVPIGQVKQLQEDFNALQSRITTGEAETAVNQAVKDGKVAPALKTWALDLAKTDPAKFQAYCSGAPVLTAPQLLDPQAKTEGVDLTNPVELAAQASAYQKKQADAGLTVDYATAVMAVSKSGRA